jgi:hypothetical protein
MENETYKLASELTEQQIENILFSWEGKKELQDFNCLVRLGDSKSLAISTILVDKANKVYNYDIYYNAYNN